MFYTTGETPENDLLLARVSAIDLLAPQCYWIDRDGFIHGELPSAVNRARGVSRIALMPLVYNQDFNREIVTALLHNPEAQARAIHYTAYLARRDNAVGFQLDFENINPSDRLLFTQFADGLAKRLHRDGRLLSVAVVPRFSDELFLPGENSQGYTGEWSGAYDYRALGRAADFLTLMAYDHSTRAGPAGPIAGYAWIKKALDYAVERVPREKLVLGIPLYGRDWAAENEATTSRSLTSKDIRALLERHEIQPQWNEQWRSPWFNYMDGGISHTVWFEDSRSWRAKFRLMREYHLKGYAAWRLGFEGPEFWAEARKDTSLPTKELRSSQSGRANQPTRLRSRRRTGNQRSAADPR
jgi:spore germination protein